LFRVLIFKLEEQTPAILLHLPNLFSETTIFGSASSLGCLLVVAFAQGLLVEQGFFYFASIFFGWGYVAVCVLALLINTAATATTAAMMTAEAATTTMTKSFTCQLLFEAKPDVPLDVWGSEVACVSCAVEPSPMRTVCVSLQSLAMSKATAFSSCPPTVVVNGLLETHLWVV
jgi:hypothetical protein